ncbi:MAG TPA: hypothetical protein VD973_25675 [Symbiobacteriaceae bacterium]|nr:hypothetical protein [Symbiobacteriaceae bacterium]
MLLHDLRNELARRLADGHLVLDEQTGNFAPLAGVFPLCPGRRLALTGAELTPPEGPMSTLTVSGTWDGTWTVPGVPDTTLQNLRLTMTFPALADGSAGLCDLSLDGLLVSPHCQMSVTGAPASDTGWWLCLAGEQSTAVGLGGLAGISPQGTMVRRLPAALLSQVGTVQLRRWEMVFDPNDTAIQSLTYEAAAADAQWALIPNALTVSNPGLAAEFTRRPRGGFQVEGQISGTAALGGTAYRVALDLGSGSHVGVSIQAAPDARPLNLADLGALLGGGEQLASVQDTLAQVGFHGVQLSRLHLVIDLSGPKVEAATIAGQFFLDDVKLDLQFHYPQLSFGGGLAPDSKLDLRALVQRYIPDATNLPELTVSKLRTEVYPRSKTVRLQAALEGDWTVPVGKTRMGLTGLGLDLVAASAGTRAQIIGRGRIDNADCFATIALPSLAVSLGLVPGSQLNLTSLVRSLLPDDLTVPDDLPEIILRDLSLSADYQAGTFRLDSRATAKPPGLRAKVNRLEVAITELGLEMAKSPDRTFARLFTQIRVGDAPFDFEFRLPGPGVSAGLAAGATFNLTQTLASLLPEELAAPQGLPEVTFNKLHLDAEPTSGTFSITAASGDTWPIPLGQGLSVGNLSLTARTDKVNGKLVPSGEVGGTLHLGGTEVKGLVRLEPGDVLLRTQIPSLRLFGLLESIIGRDALRTLPVPDEVWNLELRDISTEVAPLTPRFVASAAVPGFDRMFVLVQGGKEKAGFLAGLVAAPEWHPSKLIPLLSPLDHIRFKRTYLIVSSMDGKAKLPEELARQVAAAGAELDVHRGVNFSASVDLSDTGVKELLGLSQLDMLGYFDPTKPEAELKTGIQGEFPLGTDQVKLREVGLFLRLQGSAVGVGVGAKIGVKVHTDELLFGGEIGVSTKSVKGTVNMLGTWNNPFGVQGLALSDVGLDLGFTYATRVPELGMIGSTRIGSVATTAAVKFDSGDPTRCMLQMRLQNLKLREMLETLCQGPIIEAIPAQLKQTIDTAHLKEAEVYVAPQATTVGGIPCEQGIRLKGDIELWEVEAKASAEVSFDQGLKLSADISKDIEVGDVFKLKGLEEGKTPHLYVEIPPPGKLPVIDIEGNLSMLNITNQRTKMQVRDSGFYFEQETKLFDLLQAKLMVSGGLKNGSAGIHVKGDFRDDLTERLQQEASAVMHDAANKAKGLLTGAQNTMRDWQGKLDDANRKIYDLMQQTHATIDAKKREVEAKRLELEAARSQVATWENAVEAARRAVEADRQRARAHLDNCQRDLNNAQAEVDRIRRQITETEHWFNNLNWIEKAFQAVPTGIKLGALWAAYGTASLVLQAVSRVVEAARAVVNSWNTELDPRVLVEKAKKELADKALALASLALQGLIDGLSAAQRGFDAAFAGLADLLVTAQRGLQGAIDALDQVKRGLEIGEELLDQVISAAGRVFSVREASFEANLDVLKGGFITIRARIMYLGREVPIYWHFNFHSPVESLKAVAEYVLGRKPAGIEAWT